MRKKFLREMKKNLITSNSFWKEDIKDIIHIANISYKKCKREEKEHRKKKNE